MTQAHILIVEDESVIRASLRRLLERNDYTVSEAGSVREAQEHCCFDDLALIISDLRLPGAPGTDMIRIGQGTPVLIMTSYASLSSAVNSMKQGAVDYIPKPFDYEEMVQRVKAILAKGSINSSVQDDDGLAQNTKDDSFCGIIGKSPTMQDLFQRIMKVAPTSATVLVQGESGTGKELVAKALHENSLRASGPMISVNCAAIPETLIESELFGHEKGSFTGATVARTGLIEAASGGTLFLDEIGELPLEAQARLLRVLQENEIRRVGSVQSLKVDVRMIAATHRNLYKLSRESMFREDLYYRLNVIELRIPPLRDRGNDILLIAEKLLKIACERMGKDLLSFSPDALAIMNKHEWPGNIRELQHAIERAVILSEDNIITPESLDVNTRVRSLAFKSDESKLHNGQSLENYFQNFVLDHEDNMTETELAQKLGISRKTLWERRQRMGIPKKKTNLV